MSEFTYNKLVYELKELRSRVTNKPILYYRIKDKYKPIEDLYIDITTNLNVYILADKFTAITTDILAIYRTITSMMRHFDICPINYLYFGGVKTNLFILHKYWVRNLSYIIEDRVYLDENVFMKGNVFARKQIFHRQYDIDDILAEMKTKFTYKNSIVYINNLKSKIDNFSEHIGNSISDNRINAYLFKVNELINDYIKEHDYVFKTRAATVIQRAFRKYRYNPKYHFCERVQMNNMREIYNEFNMQL
jgi:hypothetical protein